MRKWVALPVLAAVGACLVQAQQPKVAILNIQRAIVATNEGKKASADLQTKYAPRQQTVQSEQSAINTLKDQLQKGQNTMSESAKASLISDIDDRTKKLNREMEDDEADLQQDQQKAVRTIGQKMLVVIDKYARDHGYTLVLDVSSPQTPVVYAATGIDITQDIVRLYDQNTSTAPSSSSATPKPAPHSAAGPAKTNH